jgi:hypothetical protein
LNAHLRDLLGTFLHHDVGAALRALDSSTVWVIEEEVRDLRAANEAKVSHRLSPEERRPNRT